MAINLEAIDELIDQSWEQKLKESDLLYMTNIQLLKMLRSTFHAGYLSAIQDTDKWIKIIKGE